MRRALSGLLAALAIAGTAAAPQAAQAQAFSAQAPLPHFTAVQAADFSKQIEDDLAAKGARLAMVFRAGRPRDKLPDGLAYTHGAFWVYRDIKAADGQTLSGYAVYNLYAGDGKAVPVGRSSLVQDFPLDFIRGSTVDDVAVIVPSPEMQRRILAVIDSPRYAALHNPAYSLVANPWESRFQNCNGFMLDVISTAAWNVADPRQLRANIKAHFKPSLVEANGFARALGPLFDRRLTMADQSGPIRTAAYESLSVFMRDNALLQETYRLDFKPS